jgi:hypothetical protein
MGRSSRRLALLAGVLGVVVAGVAATSLLRQPTADAGDASAKSPAAQAADDRERRTLESVETVRLDDLKSAHPDPVAAGRDPFSFKTHAVPTPRPAPTTGGSAAPGPAPAPSAGAPGGQPSMGLKFIGIVDAPAQGGRLAVLSDGRSVFYGHEGEVVDGRFKIARIGIESIEMIYVDGQGRQTIRLSGQ